MQAILNNLLDLVLAGLGGMLVLYFKEMKADVKAMSGSMIDLNLKVSTVITKHDHTEKLAEKNSEELDKVRERLHSLEGGQAQLLHFIEEK